MKRYKLVLKILLCCLACFWMLVAALHFTLVYISSKESTKNKIIDIIKEKTFADAEIGSLSASIFDIKIKDLNLSIENKNIAHIDTAYVRFSLIHLIKGHIRINNIAFDNFNLNIIKDKDGKFNFDPVLESPAFKTEDSANKGKKKEEKDDDDDDPLNLKVSKFQLNDCSISYRDEQQNLSLIIDGISFDIDNFNFKEPFKLNSYLNIYLKTPDLTVDRLHITLNALTDLKSLNLQQAETEIILFGLRLKDTAVLTKGKITDFQNPKIDLNTKITDLSSESFKNIAELPNFLIPEINIKTLLDCSLEKSRINIKKFNTNVADCDINADGKIDYGKQELEYDINLTIKFILDKICQMAELTKQYKPKGSLEADLKITNGSETVKGKFSVIDVSAFLPQLGDLTELNSDIAINSIDDIQMPSLTGKINSYPFESSASYLMQQDRGKIKADFFANRIYGKMSKEYAEKAEKEEEIKDRELVSEKTLEEMEQKENKKIGKKTDDEKNIQQTRQEKISFKPLDIEVNFNVKDMNVPYFMGKDINFTMDMKNITPDLTDIAGILSLTTDNGTIKDIYKLTEANAVMKGLFLSLKIVSNVINALNVLDILNSIGSAIVSPKDKKGNIVEISEEDDQNRKQKLDGQIDFLSFITSIDFEKGKGIFDSCSFVSNLMSFKVSGDINFKDNLVNMIVNAAPGRHEEDGGIMPLKMKIGGTVDEPRGSLSVLGSLTTLVGDTLTKNIVSGSLKSGFTKLLGLKKYDDDGNDIDEDGDVKKSKKKKKKSKK